MLLPHKPRVAVVLVRCVELCMVPYNCELLYSVSVETVLLVSYYLPSYREDSFNPNSSQRNRENILSHLSNTRIPMLMTLPEIEPIRVSCW
jgi:hypothetical protein